MNDECLRGGDSSRHDLKERTKKFAIRVLRLYAGLPKTTEAQVLGKQVLRSGTSVGAHYREATRARSTAEFVSKIEVGLQELEETMYWLELLAEVGIENSGTIRDTLTEAEELVRIFVASVRTAKTKR